MLVWHMINLALLGLAAAVPHMSTSNQIESVSKEITNGKTGPDLSWGLDIPHGTLCARDGTQQHKKSLDKLHAAPMQRANVFDLNQPGHATRTTTDNKDEGSLKAPPDSWTVFLKNSSMRSPQEHAAWASALQRDSKTNPHGYKGAPGGKSWLLLPSTRIYWATFGNETLKQVRKDPYVSSVHAVHPVPNNVSALQALSSRNDYMITMDPRAKMDLWTHAKIVTRRFMLQFRDDLRIDNWGITAFYDDGFKSYDGFFDPETKRKIAEDSDVAMVAPMVMGSGDV